MKCQNCGAEIQNAKAKFCPKCGAVNAAAVSAQVASTPAFAHDISAVWPEWKIEKQLGKGSYGVVYQAVRNDNNVESKAAIKVITIPTDSSEVDSLRSEGLDMDGTKSYFKGIVDEFVGEIQLMESLKGMQNIVSVEDYKVVERTDEIGWNIYIRMELLTPFNNYICDKNITEAEVIKLGTDICTALEICSQRNIIHRDIKPENIFVNDFGYYKLGDFGIARKLENVTGGLSQKGTFNYMAPEVANSSEYDARVDTYSLGLVLYRLLNNNKLPFLDTEKQLLSPSERKNAVERRLRGETLTPPAGASAEMADLILRACSYQPGFRFASATEMKEALIKIQSGTYKVTDSNLDKTTSVRRTGDSLNSTTSVRKAPADNNAYAGPVVDSFDKSPKKGKGKKGLIIALVIVVLIVGIAVSGVVYFFTSPGYKVSKDMRDNNVSVALEAYNNDVKDKFIQQIIVDKMLADRVDEVVEEYKNGELKYDTAISALSALGEMGFEGTDEKRTDIMAAYANDIVSQYESGKMTYDDAKTALEGVKADGYAEADTLIQNITSSNDAVNALEKADDYYESGDYENAITEYEKVPESDENYAEAQEKLAKVYKDYISKTVKSAKNYNSAKNYKQAIQVIETAYGVLPASVDKSELDTVKEESLTGYKTSVADDVAEYKEDEKWSEAFAAIDDAIAFDDNEYFQTLKTNTEEDYVKSVTATVNAHLEKEDYISAKRVADNALTVLPNNTALKELKEDVEKATPVYLLDVCDPYASSKYKEYVNGELINMGGTSYTNAFALEDGYAIFNIDSKYSTLSFMLGHCDGTDMRSTTVKIYCDGILKKQIDLKAEALPQKVTIDITGVNQLKIESSQYWTYYGFANVTVK